ncbi:MAG: hypothetical protein CFH10_01159 [Alphaproteobacteria bacterium MarineAlpha4_Bin2]|nr:MAG: hypothetical protein CFH10_01159 [Alphaproteobacteria bacterium MarineAlpha4_Bin2]
MTQADPRLRKHREAWESKPGLRAVYADYHHRLLDGMPEAGPILEIGGGSGNLRDMAPNVISIDLAVSPWVDVCCDAHELPFADGSFAGIVMLDVLHHLARPVAFFTEAARALRTGGRLAMIEPGMTPLSLLFYTHLHHEPVDMSVDPLADQPPEVAVDPFWSNQAIPSLLFGQSEGRERFEGRIPEFRVVRCADFSFLAYPLSGGFKRWSLLPGVAAPALIGLDNLLSPLVGSLIGFRIGILLERI